jgi:hypothetical protein
MLLIVAPGSKLKRIEKACREAPRTVEAFRCLPDPITA